MFHGASILSHLCPQIGDGNEYKITYVHKSSKTTTTSLPVCFLSDVVSPLYHHVSMLHAYIILYPFYAMIIHKNPQNHVVKPRKNHPQVTTISPTFPRSYPHCCHNIIILSIGSHHPSYSHRNSHCSPLISMNVQFYPTISLLLSRNLLKNSANSESPVMLFHVNYF